MSSKLTTCFDRALRDDRVLRAPLAVFFAFSASALSLRLLRVFQGRQADEIVSNSLNIVAACAYLTFVIVLFWLTILREMPSKSAAGVSPRLFAFFGTFSSLLLGAVPTADVPDGIRVVGIALVFVGAVLSITTVSWLGRSFSVVPQSRRLVTRGPYAVVRHPLYVSEEIIFFGVVLDHCSWLAVLIVALQWLCQLQRMKFEERILVEAFPEYVAYARKTPALFPRLRFGGS